MLSLPPAPERGARLLLAAMRARKEPVVLASRSETPLHRAADAHIERLAVAIRYAFAMGRGALGKGDAANAAKAVRKALGATLPKTLAKVLAAGGEVGVSALRELRTAAPQAKGKPHTTRKPFRLAFDVTNPAVLDWIEQHSAELIKGITETTEQRIKDAIARAAETGEDAHDLIAAAVGDDARATLIARTETMTAANAGQRLAWDQAAEEGLLPSDAKRVWIATADEGVCPICEDLDGQTAPLDGEYPDPGGEGPPAHPQCRCTEGIS